MPEETQPIVHDTTPATIEEPPLKNRQSCLWRSCGLIFFLIIFVFAFFAILSTFVGGPAAQRLASLPSNFPSDIPIYRFPDRSSINYSAAPKSINFWQRLALLPRYILGPAILKLKPDLSQDKRLFYGERIIGEQISWAGLNRILYAAQLGTGKNATEIVWENLDDSVRKIANFYKKNLEQQDYLVEDANKNSEQESYIFNKGAVTGELNIYFTSQEKEKSVDSVNLKVVYPSD